MMYEDRSQRTQPLMLTLCLEEDSILISEAVLAALEHPKQIQLMINEKERKLLLQACTVDEKQAIVVPPQYYLQFEMSGHALLKKIKKLTGWADNRPRVMYGELFFQHHAVLFDLRGAALAELKAPPPPAGMPS